MRCSDSAFSSASPGWCCDAVCGSSVCSLADILNVKSEWMEEKNNAEKGFAGAEENTGLSRQPGERDTQPDN